MSPCRCCCATTTSCSPCGRPPLAGAASRTGQGNHEERGWSQMGIELERTVASIQVGHRHRSDLGDIDALAASISEQGLLQPLTVTPEGVLVCGRRRLAAIQQLGWRTVSVWVRSGVSDRLGHLLAEQDENVHHKQLTQVEAAALYRELKALMAEDASRRQAASQFSTARQPGSDGGGKFP